jgi:ubiquinone/menaquinone biosynthesis C-methylase UbiE
MSNSGESHAYFTDAENVAEMARLTRQAQMLSRQIGVLPSQITLPQAPALLDLGCGPGEWVLHMASRMPDAQVTGIDISNVMIEYARFRAEEEGLHNTRFYTGDILKLPLPFPDASFDLIYARFIVGFMRVSSWHPLWRECYRLLRPGGIMCHTDLEDFGLTNSAAFTRFNALTVEACRRTQQCFSVDGGFTGITMMQAQIFQDAGFQNIAQQAHSINFSAGAPAYQDVYEDRQTIMKLFQPFIVAQDVASQEEIEQLYKRTMEDMRSASFRAIVYYQTTWGQKPL